MNSAFSCFEIIYSGQPLYSIIFILIGMRCMNKYRITDDLNSLLDIMPEHIKKSLESHPSISNLTEIVLDLGRKPEARFETSFATLSELEVTKEDLIYVTSRTGKFGADNRAGIEKTLHRISAIRNRIGEIIGLTCRVGRAVYGTVDIISDLLQENKSILVMGSPGVGKTTILRELARILSDDYHKRVVIVDTSNEIAGDGDIPHAGIGSARRMQVPSPNSQHAVMIEAVENHMPQVIVVDEIGVLEEAYAARTIAERGVQLIATAHGSSLENLVQNPTLSDLAGGIQSVTLSDDEAKRRHTQKTILERKAPPTFDMLVEIKDRNRFVIHRDLAQATDSLLRGFPLSYEERVRHEDGNIEINTYTANLEEEQSSELATKQLDLSIKRGGQIRIFPYGVSRNRLEKAIHTTSAPATIVRGLHEADIILTLKNQERFASGKGREAQARGIPVFIARSNSVVQLEGFLLDFFGEFATLNDER